MADPTPTPTAPPPAQPAPTPLEAEKQPASPTDSDERFFAALGYFAFLFVIPLIVKPKSEYCKFHARQSMVLFLMTIVVLIILASIPWFGSLLTLALFAVYILAIYRSYKGDLWKIPVVSGLAGKLNVEAMYGKAGASLAGLSTGIKSTAEGLASKATDTVKDMGKQEETPKPPEVTPPPAATPPAAK